MRKEKKFLICFFTSLATLILLSIAVMIIINPRELFPTKFFTPLTDSNLLDIKLSLLNKLDYEPKIYVLGSSTSFRLNTDSIKNTTGKNAFNLAIDNGRAEDFLVISKILINDMKKKPEAVIIGLNLFSLKDSDLLPSARIVNKFYIKYLKIKKAYIIKHYYKTILENLTESYFKDVARIIYYNLTSYPEKNNWDVSETGNDKRKERQYEEGAYEIYRRGDDKKLSYQEEKLEELASFLDENNVKIFLFLTPTHPDTMKKLKADDNYINIYNEAVKFSDKLSRYKNFNFYNFSEIGSFGGTRSSFSDFTHIGKENSDKIIEKIFKK